MGVKYSRIGAAKLFQDTPVQDKHENFIQQVTVITASLLVMTPKSPWRQKFGVHDWLCYVQFAL